MATTRTATSGQSSLRQFFTTAALGLATLLVLASGASAQFEEPTNYVEASAVMHVRDPSGVTTMVLDAVTWDSFYYSAVHDVSTGADGGWTVPFHGGGWPAGVTMDIYLYGPLNSLGVTPIKRGPILSLVTDANGEFQGSFDIPYENDGTFGPEPIMRPGLYIVRADRHGVVFPTAFDTAGSEPFSICPNTIPPEFNALGPLDWTAQRGARDGWLGEYSPERTDPEWVTAWSLQPVGLYATVASTNSSGLEQAAHVAYHDYPASHFAHDLNLHLVPDADYLWVLGTANLLGNPGDPGDKETGRIEWEWEMQNSGHPSVESIGQGDIGVPMFAMATVGDRVYTVGRWVLDNGHPDEGGRTEIHPPRMIATMRKRPTIVPLDGSGAMTRAAQVDVFVSGHGGGINKVAYPEMERLLDNNGLGGGRLIDYGIGDSFGLLHNEIGLVYERVGPDFVVHDTLGAFIDIAADLLLQDIPTLYPTAGPSAFSTGSDGLPTPGPGLIHWAHGAEFQPVNDMDYEFDVPLPPKPPGATTPLVQVTKHSMDSTNVEEIITYSGAFARVRLPYKDADNGVYARTLKFYWDTYSSPGDHFIVQINDIETARAEEPSSGHISGPQPLYLWADVCGQWRFLNGLFAPDNDPLLTPVIGANLDHDHVSLDGFQGTRFDCYLDSGAGDTLRVFVGGYAQRDMDGLFGNLYGLNAYDAGIYAADAYYIGNGDNQNIGGAVFDSWVFPASLDHVTVVGQSSGVFGGLGGPFPDDGFIVTFSTTYVPRPPRILASDEQLSFGTTCPGSSTSLPLQIANGPDAQSSLVVNNFSLVGSGFSLVSPPALPLTLAPGASQTLTIGFSPTTSGAATGSLAIGSNDPAFPQLAVNLSGSVGSPTIAATADTSWKPTVTLSSPTTWPVTISNTGECTLNVQPSITGTGGTWEIVLPADYYNPLTSELLKDIVVEPGGVNTDLSVSFTPTTTTFKAEGTLTMTSDDAQNPTTTLVFGAEGVPVGVRVLVVGGDGTPYPVVDEIKLKSKKPNKFKSDLKAVPLTTIDPPESWKRIQFHYMTALDPAEDGTDYALEVKVGNNKQDVDFTLAPDEFRELTVTLP